MGLRRFNAAAAALVGATALIGVVVVAILATTSPARPQFAPAVLLTSVAPRNGSAHASPGRPSRPAAAGTPAPLRALTPSESAVPDVQSRVAGPVPTATRVPGPASDAPATGPSADATPGPVEGSAGTASAEPPTALTQAASAMAEGDATPEPAPTEPVPTDAADATAPATSNP